MTTEAAVQRKSSRFTAERRRGINTQTTRRTCLKDHDLKHDANRELTYSLCCTPTQMWGLRLVIYCRCDREREEVERSSLTRQSRAPGSPTAFSRKAERETQRRLKFHTQGLKSKTGGWLRDRVCVYVCVCVLSAGVSFFRGLVSPLDCSKRVQM